MFVFTVRGLKVVLFRLIKIKEFNRIHLLFMRTRDLIIAGIAGTTLMTAFSHLISHKRKKNFSEPELLGAVLQGTPPATANLPARIAGWALHYMTGIAFATTYAFVLRLAERQPSLVRALVFGVASGAISIVAWKTFFFFDKKIAKLKDDEYFLQLFLAHIVFAITCSQTYALLKKQSGVKNIAAN